MSSSSSSCTHTDGKWRALAILYFSNNVIGAAAWIDTKSPKLRCEPDSTFYTSSNAWVGPQRTDADQYKGQSFWCQTGWIRWRNPQVMGPMPYFECNSPNDYYVTNGVLVPISGPNPWSVELDQSTGTWTGKLNGATWEGDNGPSYHANSYWQKYAGDNVQYSGEVHSFETCMPGTSASPCDFTTCQYKLSGGGWTGTNLTSNDLMTPDPPPAGQQNPFAVVLDSATSFHIYDTRSYCT